MTAGGTSQITAPWPRRMRQLYRRGLAQAYYLRRPVCRFLPVLLITIAIVAVGGMCFQQYYQHEKLRYSEALYLTYCLIFMEHLYEYPEDGVLQMFYWILPPLGLVVVIEGILRFSYHILRRDENGKEWNRAMASTLKNHVVLCGLGKLGLRVLQQLLQLGEDVIILEKNKHSPNIAFAQKNGVSVLIGTGREEGILEDLNIANAKSIILATDDDLANLEMALDARKIREDIRVVLRMFDQELASKVRDSFDIPLAFSTSALSAPLFATSSSDRSIINSFYVGDRLLVVARITIRSASQLIGTTVRSLRTDKQIFIVSTARDGTETFYPSGDLVLQAGDRLTLQTEVSTLRQVHEWNNDPQPY